jgi:glycine cleavage system pyridoxal-binding protein P
VSRIWVRTAFYWQVAVVFVVTAGFNGLMQVALRITHVPHLFNLALMSALAASLTSGFISFFWQRTLKNTIRLLELHGQTRELVLSRIRSALQILAALADTYEQHEDAEHRRNGLLVREQVSYISKRIQFDSSAMLHEDLKHAAQHSVTYN